MALQEKYRQLIQAAQTRGVNNLQIREQDGVLYLDGEAPTGTVKDELWNIYGQIDPNYSGGDLVLDINTRAAVGGKVKVVTKIGNLNIRKGPGTDQPIVGKAAHHEIITLVNKSNDQWWLVRTPQGEEGYSYAEYLEPVN